MKTRGLNITCGLLSIIISQCKMKIMDVSKISYVCIKRMDVFHIFMDKPTATLVQLAVRALILFFMGFFKYVRFMGEDKNYPPS